jgi:hypothetical protein
VRRREAQLVAVVALHRRQHRQQGAQAWQLELRERRAPGVRERGGEGDHQMHRGIIRALG